MLVLLSQNTQSNENVIANAVLDILDYILTATIFKLKMAAIYQSQYIYIKRLCIYQADGDGYPASYLMMALGLLLADRNTCK